MRNAFWIFLIVLVIGFCYTAHSQSPAGVANMGFEFYDNPSSINTNFGLTQIGDITYVGFRFQPEIAIGKLGFGLDVPVLFNMDDNSFKKNEFEGGAGYLRLLSYARWGKKKKDPLFIRVGDLRGSYLGFGILLNNYSNSISYEKRKIGLSFDFVVNEKYGLEGIYSDFNTESFSLLALRPYYRPFGNTWIPIIKTLELGVGYVMDYDQTPSLFEEPVNSYLSKGMHAWSLDAGVFLINTKFIDWTLYTQFGMLMKNNVMKQSIVFPDGAVADVITMGKGYTDGYGFSVGTAASMNVIGDVLRVIARVERLWYSDYFIPGFFDATYEINKDARIASLIGSEGTSGTYATLAADLINEIIVGGGILLPDKLSENNTAMVNLSLDIPHLIPRIIISGQYFRGGIAKLDDAFVLDENSLATARVAYKLFPFAVVGVDYKWSFVTGEDGYLEIDKQIMPYFGIHIPLNFD